MRVGLRIERAAVGQELRRGLDQDNAEFLDSMGYAQRHFATREDFLRFFSASWIREVQGVLREWLRKDRPVLSVGAGECEIEIPLFLEGYDLTGSDLLPEALEAPRRLFPEFPTLVFDVLQPDPTIRFPDLFVPGMDAYFDGPAFDGLLAGLYALLPPGGRLLFAQRCHDTWFTRLCDRLAFPVLVRALNLVARLRGRPHRYGLKVRGYRRRPVELCAAARRAGFTCGRVRRAGFGVELTRLYLDRLAPPLYRLLQAADRRLGWFHNVTLWEFVRPG